jgi:hypothetical protein
MKFTSKTDYINLFRKLFFGGSFSQKDSNGLFK